MDSELGKSEETGKEMPMYDLNCHKGTTQFTCGLSGVYCIAFPPNDTFLVLLLSVFVGILFQSQNKPGLLSRTTGPVARYAPLPRLDLHLWLETQALLQAPAGHLHTREAYHHWFKNEALCVPALLPLLDIPRIAYYFLACSIFLHLLCLLLLTRI